MTSPETKTQGTVMRGIAVSRGVSAGPIKILREISDQSRLEPGDLAVIPTASADWVGVLRNATGVIAIRGAALSALGSISREFEIPMVVCGDIDPERIQEGILATIDGMKGEVEIIDPINYVPPSGHELGVEPLGRRARS